MTEDIKKRLESFEYTVIESDNWMLEFIIQKVDNDIKNSCNVSSIPEGLIQIKIDMVCGEFLLAKKQSGQLEGFNIDTAVKQIKEGDTTISYAIGDGSNTPEQRLDLFINFILTNGRSQFVKFRRLSW